MTLLLTEPWRDAILDRLVHNAYKINGLWTLLSNFSAHKFVWGNCIGRCTGIE